MSHDLNKENNSLVTYRRNAHFGSSVQYTSSIVINLRQCQSDIQTQYQHEKDALNELNQRFHIFVDRVKYLESQNSKYLAELAAFQRPTLRDSSIDLKSSEYYFNTQSDISTLRSAQIDCESDFEWSKFQIGIYQQLFDTEQQWKEKRFIQLEQELKQLADELVNIRSSYTELERRTINQYTERDDIFKQYLALTHEWCNIRSQRKKWDLSMETLKTYIAFYKNIRSYSTRKFESTIIQSEDSEQYWAIELDQTIKKIRHDFEAFYATIFRGLTTYYETKMEEINKEVEQTAHYQRIESEEFVMVQQSLQIEYEKFQSSLTYERESIMKLESTYSNLESNAKTLALQYEDQLESQSREVQSLQESIMMIAYDINEIQRSKINLETEIVIYRYLLDTYGTGERQTIVPQKQIDTYAKGERVTIVPQKQIVVSNEFTTGKFFVRGRKKGFIGIKECAANGKYISLVNHSSNKDIDISRWVLKQRIDSTSEIRYTIPNGTRLQQGKELRIYSKHNADLANGSAISALVQKQLVNNDVASWGVGDIIETRLLNHNGEEEASYLQSMELRKSNM
ncbi:unnamed protein product [Adineta steineri]|uniref:LTD domain-containing protein n=1 Tax=Adineta steineri TaxID=433720 RepID=A0A814MI64_9BILA|nr:unnamed protein product [Adineta steineri]CAF3548106.1 unnamed protein product [Adineta steineri]